MPSIVRTSAAQNTPDVSNDISEGDKGRASATRVQKGSIRSSNGGDPTQADNFQRHSENGQRLSISCSTSSMKEKDVHPRRSSGEHRTSLVQLPTPLASEAGGATGIAHAQNNMFADADAMREKMHENLGEKDYDVSIYYWDTGFCQRVARNSRFDSFTLGVILLNAVWIGIDAECNDPNATDTIPNCPAQPGDKAFWMIGEQLFCIFFTFELSVRFGAFEVKRNCLRDGWFCFDTTLVFFMVVETWVLPVITGGNADALSDFALIRMLRLMRLTRMVRLMRSVPELVTLLKGMVIACRSVSYTLLLLLIFMYIFSIIFKSQLVDTEVDFLKIHFSGIPRSMWTLLLNGCLLDGIGKVANTLMDDSPMLATTFIFFVLLSSLMVLNMLIGVLCAVVTAVAAAEKEKALVTYVKAKLMDVLVKLDKDGSGEISKEEFDDLVKNEEAVKALEDLGVDVPNLVSLSDHLFDGEDLDDGHHKHRDSTAAGLRHSAEGGEKEEKQMSFADFLEMVIRLRSDCQPSVADIVDLRKLIFKGQKHFTRRVNHIERGQLDLQRGIRTICEQLDAALTLSLRLSEESDGRNSKSSENQKRGGVASNSLSVLQEQGTKHDESASGSLVHHEL